MSSKFILFLLSVILTTKCVLSSDSEQEPPEQNVARILSARKANLGQFPYVVFVQNKAANPKWTNTGWVCTGSILTRVWIITARHCYSGYAKRKIPLSEVETFVRAGTVDRATSTPQTQDRYAIKHVQQDPDPSIAFPAIFNNNIILVQCDKPFFFNSFVNAITPVRGPFPDGYKHTCVMVGFGRYYPAVDAHEVLFNTELHYAYADVAADPAACEKKAKKSGFGYPGHWSAMQICAQPHKYAQAPCDGDSGSPLICAGSLVGTESGRLNVNGEVKAKCGVYGNYHVYMSVSAAEQWMRKHVRDLPRFEPMNDEVYRNLLEDTMPGRKTLESGKRSRKSDGSSLHLRTVENCILLASIYFSNIIFFI